MFTEFVQRDPAGGTAAVLLVPSELFSVLVEAPSEGVSGFSFSKKRLI